VSWERPESVHRTAIQFLETGAATSPEEAVDMLARLVLQVHVAKNACLGRSGTAALGTVVNAGRRAFLGGVHVRLEEDLVLAYGWAKGQHLSKFVEGLGGTVVDALSPEHLTLSLGQAVKPVGRVVLHPTWHGWSAGVVLGQEDRLDGHGLEIAAIAAGALGVSEAFQFLTGRPGPGRRDVGVSLWLPGTDWRLAEATGPMLACLPSGIWLLGLGHLGQGYAWSMGWLNYEDPGSVVIGLVDDDTVELGNDATGMLLQPSDVDARKTRVVARELERLGFQTRVVDRRFDEQFVPQEKEPTVALAGFDSPSSRQNLGARFGYVIDGGLGVGARQYLSIAIHTFPSTLDPRVEFVPSDRASGELAEAYEAAIGRLIADGVPAGTARCGVTMIAGTAVAAAFVGTFAGVLAVADLLRLLHGGPALCRIRCDLRNPNDLRGALNLAPGPVVNRGFSGCRPPADTDRF